MTQAVTTLSFPDSYLLGFLESSVSSCTLSSAQSGIETRSSVKLGMQVLGLTVRVAGQNEAAGAASAAVLADE
jgi:hypothetical protein